MKYGLDYGRFITDVHVKIDFDKLRRDRLERARAQMIRDGLGAMLLFDPTNLRYVASFSPQSYTIRADPRSYGLLLKNGGPYLWTVGAWHMVLKEEMPWLKGNVRLSMGPAGLIVRESAASGGGFIREIAKILAEHGVTNELLGIDGLATVSAVTLGEACKKVGIKFAESRDTMPEARKIKTKEEIELLRMSAAIAESAFADVREAVRPGITENELAGIIMKKLFSMGAEWVDGLVICFGENGNPNRRTFSDRILRAGDMGFIDIVGSQFCGYRTCYYRSFTVGRATQEQKDLYQSAYDMLYAGMNVIKAGNTTLDIVNKWPGPEHWGYDNEEIVYENKMGHGIGLSQYDLPFIITSAAKANPVVLEEDMVFALEVWEGKRGGKQGCKIEEEIAVTKDGYDLLTKWPVKELTDCWR